MILQCPRCNAKFKVPDNAVPPMGREVRCSKCAFAWHAKKPEEVDPGFDMLIGDDVDPDENPEDAASRLLSSQPAPAKKPKAPPPKAPSGNPDDDDYGSGFPQVDEGAAFKKDSGSTDLVFEDAAPSASDDDSSGETEAAFDAAFAKNLEKIFEEGVTQEKKKPSKAVAKSDTEDGKSEKPALPPKKIGMYVWIAIALTVPALVASVFAFRTTLQPAMPGLYEMLGMPRTDGLVLMDLKLIKKPTKNKAKFIIEGRIVNQATEPRRVPMVRVGIVSKTGEMLMMREYETKGMIKPDEAYPFTASKLETNFIDKVDHLVIDIGNGTELMLRE